MKVSSKIIGAMFCLMLFAGGFARAQEQKDYLSTLEAEKIRDAETTNDRVKLFLTFADDRLKKFQYELEHPSGTQHIDMLNSLLNGYGGGGGGRGGFVYFRY